ncbi:UDP-n-acetylglucosamine transferase subunit alg14 [Fusarium beomiforme]|uniref:UDP-N-acetylglucosamine transferase subunit ALG14 n=1 Tax=Fusarium beomiforme TaxID=44412 RepID=A0A9P5AU88_9HYPO|nr:UDP-n-acetylglucosamine transferase subunit alg14 [Fusarium beomiforme]
MLLYIITLLIVLTVRHIQLVRRRRRTRNNKLASLNKRRTPYDYRIFVLGSGGHTKEMLMMMDDGFCNFNGFHRRYIISSGDTMSENHLEDYEADLKTLCVAEGTNPGRYDVFTVTRARRVHQSLLTTPFSAFLSMCSIFPALLTPAPRVDGLELRYPVCIYSNGPATGFFVGLAVHLLKIVGKIPENSMHFIYIESWARISTLSLTGKLFYYTGIADIFVQHKQVAEKYGLKNCGEMVFNARRPDVSSTDDKIMG